MQTRQKLGIVAAAVISFPVVANAASATLVVTLTALLFDLPPGDCDEDQDVDLADFLVRSGCLTGPDAGPLPPLCVCADLDGDEDTDLADAAFFQNIFSGRVVLTPPVDTQLAGNPLTPYPFFEYVRAFNSGEPVGLAIDPTRFPAITGQTCDNYVTADKNAAEWDADPTLVDVRATGPQPATFSGAAIQANTVTIDTGTLSAAAGTSIGVGYDVVLDCDQDGLLGDGDYIDGLGDEAGFYVVHDLTEAGPLAVSNATYSGGTFLGQITYWPTAIASLGQLPLVVISHGNGHNYTWYQYLQSHLASYGYIVMSHQNNTIPGVESASTTTLTNTNYILANQATIAGGALNGHIDSHKIIWIGHSRGGEGVVRAYDRLFDGTYVPTQFGLADVVLVSSIAPTDFLGPASASPHAVPYHLIYGSADGDVCGCPDSDTAQSFHLYERSVGYHQATYIHGADHNDFNCCGINDFSGPAGTAIGTVEAQRVAKAVYLALIKHYLEGNLPAKDFLWRQYERFKPIGVSQNTIVVSQYEDGPAAGNAVIDNYQTASSISVSSSGGTVTSDVLSLTEGLQNDNNTTFTWTTSDMMNGMTFARTNDVGRGAVFDWTTTTARFYEYAVVPADQDFSDDAYLSFRACQQSRHPETIAVLGDLTFTVSLRDVFGTSTAINIGAFGGGVEEPYQRTGFGAGAGWQNEFETIRIPLASFLTNGSALDLSSIEAVRFDFGAAFGSNRGRIGVDDVELTKD